MSVGIDPIDKLQLDVAFGKRFEKAWTVRADKRLLVIDDDVDHGSKFSDSEDDEPRALVVLNEKNKLIVLLAIDHQLIDNHPGGIADCAVFDENKIEFVEFKTNAYGNSEEAIRDTFDKACGQLEETLVVFKNQLLAVGVDLFQAMVVECRVVVAHRFPRATATKQDYCLQFASDTNGIELFFERQVCFV